MIQTQKNIEEVNNEAMSRIMGGGETYKVKHESVKVMSQQEKDEFYSKQQKAMYGGTLQDSLGLGGGFECKFCKEQGNGEITDYTTEDGVKCKLFTGVCGHEEVFEDG